MKKCILAVLVSIVSSSILLAYSNPPLEKGLDTLGILMEQKFSAQEQMQRYMAVQDILKTLVHQKSGTTKQNFELIITWLQNRVSQLSSQTQTQQIADYLAEQKGNLKNIDFEKVKRTWLQRHNDVRAKAGLKPYIYHDKLGYSAFTWAKHLSAIGTYTHKRKSTDGFYNYNSIKERFSDLGVEFSGKGTLFSENLASGMYRCGSNDCTDNLINAMKKNFNFFMSEAPTNGPHYRAIMHSYFNTIGVGIHAKNGKYYIVTHFGRDVK